MLFYIDRVSKQRESEFQAFIETILTKVDALRARGVTEVNLPNTFREFLRLKKNFLERFLFNIDSDFDGFVRQFFMENNSLAFDRNVEIYLNQSKRNLRRFVISYVENSINSLKQIILMLRITENINQNPRENSFDTFNAAGRRIKFEKQFFYLYREFLIRLNNHLIIYYSLKNNMDVVFVYTDVGKKVLDVEFVLHLDKKVSPNYWEVESKIFHPNARRILMFTAGEKGKLG